MKLGSRPSVLETEDRKPFWPKIWEMKKALSLTPIIFRFPEIFRSEENSGRAEIESFQVFRISSARKSFAALFRNRFVVAADNLLNFQSHGKNVRRKKIVS